MSEKKIIIGEGVAGLSAGCYAQMNGYNSVIFELHDLPGGVLQPGSVMDMFSTAVSTTCSDPERTSPSTN